MSGHEVSPEKSEKEVRQIILVDKLRKYLAEAWRHGEPGQLAEAAGHLDDLPEWVMSQKNPLATAVAIVQAIMWFALDEASYQLTGRRSPPGWCEVYVFIDPSADLGGKRTWSGSGASVFTVFYDRVTHTAARGLYTTVMLRKENLGWMLDDMVALARGFLRVAEARRACSGPL